MNEQWMKWALAGCAAVAWAGCSDEDPVVAEEDPTTEECLSEGNLCSWAGNGQAGFDEDGNPLKESMFYWPIDVTFTQNGDAYILDWNNHAVRHVAADGTLETVIGTGFVGDGPPDLSDREAPGTDATTINLNHPTQVIELPSGNLLLVAWHNHKLREYDPDTGLAYIMAGSAAGYDGDGEQAKDAQFDQPTQVILADDGSLYVLDMRNQVVRKIDADGVVSTVAGVPRETGYDGDGGDPLEAHFDFPAGSNPPPGGALALDDDGRLYVSDTLNHVIRRIDFEENVIETIAGTGMAGFSGDGGPATEAELNNPRDLLFDGDRLLYVADELNHRVRVIDIESGDIDTVAGTGEAGYDGENLPPTESSLNRPAGLAFDNEGTLYIADTYNHRVRCFNPDF